MSKIKSKEIFRFCIGGGTAVLVDYVVYNLLLLMNMDREISKIISFICGAGVGFIINKIWTFEKKKFSSKEIWKYIILYTITALVNMIVNQFVIETFHINLLGFFCATGLSTILNFIGQKFFVFTEL